MLANRDDPALLCSGKVPAAGDRAVDPVYRPRAAGDIGLAVMRRMDELYVCPFHGSRRMRRRCGGTARWQPQASAAVDAPDGAACDLPKAEHWRGPSSGIEITSSNSEAIKVDAAVDEAAPVRT